MGIKNLNRFFKEECKDAIKMTHLSKLSGKTVAVDISIYMYKFIADDCLIENMYLMLSIFRNYNITPIFVFDGKPPAEKKALMQKRKDDKIHSRNEYDILKNKLDTDLTLDEHDKQEIMNNMDLLKRNFVHISKNQIQDVKMLIRAYGASYYDAPGEADELCAMLTIRNKAWCCLSEDMDMFVYGCPRVIRYLSLLNHSVILYDLKEMLNMLGISQRQLREICVLSGTDYNAVDWNQASLYKTLKLFKKYIKNRSSANVEFYDWLIENTSYIEDVELLNSVYSMFDLNDAPYAFENISIINGPVCKQELQIILRADGFLFPVK